MVHALRRNPSQNLGHHSSPIFPRHLCSLLFHSAKVASSVNEIDDDQFKVKQYLVSNSELYHGCVAG